LVLPVYFWYSDGWYFFKNIFCFESLLNLFFDKANQNYKDNIKKYINLISFQVYQVKRIQI
jgi:hypothetical protein